ncbi:hypothetical protein C4553_02755 [Candidatus Parcubacteria bacterium]|nr:MAG: hypothetical protein C4553_02755 [Candidatus Parcubacteria bacterium]
MNNTVVVETRTSWNGQKTTRHSVTFGIAEGEDVVDGIPGTLNWVVLGEPLLLTRKVRGRRILSATFGTIVSIRHTRPPGP